MTSDITSTIRLVRRPKVETNDVGGTVWVDTVESVELEMVSTMMLEVMLEADEGTTRMQLQQLETSQNGLLAHDRKNDSFEVVRGDELKAALAGSTGQSAPQRNADHARYAVEQTPDAAEELSLVSTQMIQVMLEKPELSPQQVSEELQLLEEASGGFDPYNNC
ncbi:MAG: hypothetical protein AAF004_11895 [Pseudomonadota bacterium]